MSLKESSNGSLKRSGEGRANMSGQKKQKTDTENTNDSLVDDLIRSYQKLIFDYKEFSYSQTIRHILTKIIQKQPITNEFIKKDVMRYLIRVVHEFALNEMEVSLWAIYLENIDWLTNNQISNDELINSAYKAKQYLNEEELEPITAFLSRLNDGFLEKFDM